MRHGGIRYRRPAKMATAISATTARASTILLIQMWRMAFLIRYGPEVREAQTWSIF
jgi:hypothetical protein